MLDNNDVISYSRATFWALADAVIPYTPELAARMGPNQLFGAAVSGIEDYIIFELDHLLSTHMGASLPISLPTAVLLDIAAAQLVALDKTAHGSGTSPVFLRKGLFAALSPQQRLEAISLLKMLEIDLGSLPAPYTNNARFVVHMADILIRLSMFGYYSEWSGYGTTRLRSPEYHILEFFPLSWIQVRYPGPSYGYRDLRGFVLSNS